MQWTGKSAFPHARTPKLLGDREESGLRFARFAFHFGTPRVETALLDQPLGQRFGPGGPDRAQFLERLQRDDPVHQPARAVVQWRIGLQQQRRRPPWCFLGKVGDPDAAGDLESAVAAVIDRLVPVA